MKKRVVWLGVALLSLCGQGVSAQAGLELSQAWVRAMPPGQPATAAYLVVRNAGAEPVVINAASADRAGRVEIHATQEVDGMLSMRQQASVTVPAGGELGFAPGGLHLMLLDLPSVPREGEQVEVCLHSGEARFCTVAEVSRQGPGGESAGSAHEHHGHH